jgi:hypothetical protein
LGLIRWIYWVKKSKKRIVLNRNNQIKKAVLFFVLFHVLNAKNSIEWDVPTNYN